MPMLLAQNMISSCWQYNFFSPHPASQNDGISHPNSFLLLNKFGVDSVIFLTLFVVPYFHFVPSLNSFHFSIFSVSCVQTNFFWMLSKCWHLLTSHNFCLTFNRQLPSNQQSCSIFTSTKLGWVILTFCVSREIFLVLRWNIVGKTAKKFCLLVGILLVSAADGDLAKVAL